MKKLKKHAPRCDSFDFDPDAQLGPMKPCNCGVDAATDLHEACRAFTAVLMSRRPTLTEATASLLDFVRLHNGAADRGRDLQITKDAYDRGWRAAVDVAAVRVHNMLRDLRSEHSK